MGWTQKRKSKAGDVRYRACYRDLRGQIQAAGTYSSQREADKAWQRAEARMAEGRLVLQRHFVIVRSDGHRRDAATTR